MTDQELIERLEDGTLPDDSFHHPEHVRAAFLYLTQYPVLEALQAFSGALRRFAEAHGKPHLYHETITWAYVFLIHDRMARAGRKESWDEFARSNADLLTWKGGILTHTIGPRLSCPTWPGLSLCSPTFRPEEPFPGPSL